MFDKDEIKQALRAYSGSVDSIATHLGCDRADLFAFISSDKELNAYKKLCSKMGFDFCQDVLLKQAQRESEDPSFGAETAKFIVKNMPWLNESVEDDDGGSMTVEIPVQATIEEFKLLTEALTAYQTKLKEVYL